MSNINIFLWPFVIIIVSLFTLITIDNNMERRKDSTNAAIGLTRENYAAKQYENLTQQHKIEHTKIISEITELQLEQVKSLMLAQSLTETNTRLKIGIDEIRVVMRQNKIKLRCCTLSYEQFRLMIENSHKIPNDLGLSGSNWRQIYEECNRWATSNIQQHQESLGNGD